jgi:hypothetical protein
MNKHTAVILVLASSLFACGGRAQVAAPGSAAASVAGCPLDGKSYDVTLETPDAPPQKDTLRFSGGKFESTACTAMGFPEWTDYAAQPSGNGVGFQVTTKHPSGTTVAWNGTVDGETVEGTANRAMNGKTDVLHFKGSIAR